jgi:hypothetical protein
MHRRKNLLASESLHTRWFRKFSIINLQKLLFLLRKLSDDNLKFQVTANWLIKMNFNGDAIYLSPIKINKN